MRKLRDVLRLRFELGLSQRQIARSCSIGLGTVHDYLQRAETAGIQWPLPEGWDEARLLAAMFTADARGQGFAGSSRIYCEPHSISEECLPHLSPLGWEHINFTGDYFWNPAATHHHGPPTASSEEEMLHLDGLAYRPIGTLGPKSRP